ncbi:spore germination protein [Bacillaceae bacterium W0354]
MILKMLKKIFTDKNENKNNQSTSKNNELENKKLSTDLKKSVDIFKSIYFYPNNNDVQFRDIHINSKNIKASLLFINTISDMQLIDEHVINPLLTNSDPNKKVSDIISIQSVVVSKSIKEIVTNVNKGNLALFIDGEEQAYIVSTSKFEGRSVEQPQNEIVVKGPKEAFNEKAGTNISLIRKKIKNENLVVETSTISKRSNNELYILYVKDLASEEILKDLKERINGLDTDAIQNLSLLEQYIEDRNYSIFPTMLYTERPDRAASYLEDGYFVLIMDNSPASLVLPATFWSFYHTSEDHYLRFIYGNFTRWLRIIALLISIFTSAVYVAVTSFHTEMIPPDLLLAIAATREKVPFPAFIEILLMEIAFELIREAGLRVPTPIGPTIGIVGALILGQAAVQANIVSPIVVIVVALGGLSSFVVGDISMNFAVRIIRFAMIIAASLFGIYGMTAFFITGLFYLVSIKSFGVPYLAPLTPKYKSSKDTIFRKNLKNEFLRPGYLKPKDIDKKGVK